jgi:Zn finger protein HypA/HybF involved in hydrogenase expression
VHEAGLARDLIRDPEDLAVAEGARRVTALTVRIGSLANVTGEHLREYFAAEAEGTMVEGAVVEGAVVEVVEGPTGEEAGATRMAWTGCSWV